jgi:hypothetical protein
MSIGSRELFLRGDVISEPDPALGRLQVRLKQSLDAVAKLLNVRAMLVLSASHILQLSGQILVRGQVISQANERSDDQNVQLNGPFALENGRKHRDTIAR